MTMEAQEHLEILRADLVRAQRAESAAIRRLNEFAVRGGGDKQTFQALLDATHKARDISVAAYERWNRAVCESQTDGDGEARLNRSTHRDVG